MIKLALTFIRNKLEQLYICASVKIRESNIALSMLRNTGLAVVLSILTKEIYTFALTDERSEELDCMRRNCGAWISLHQLQL